MRNGAIDFLVTSLDEALRILKNEIRKRQPIAVGVSVPVREIVKQMLDRGVLPDLLPPLLNHLRNARICRLQARGAQHIAARPLQPGTNS